ncbi:hypothetical protein FNH07_09230 [Amycolatopsis bartoniae]|nr:hypothetical protein FNH07_09230 [Amycolatopsis bartoniae]
MEKPDFGYAVRIPQGWDERPPNLKNSPWETARFGDRTDRRHSAIVFRQPVRPADSALELAERARSSLEHNGFTDFDLAEAEVGGAPGAVLRCAKHDAGRSWHVIEYLRLDGEVVFCLGCGTSQPAEDDELFTAMADGFELLG